MSSREILLSRVRAVRRRWRSQALARGLSLFLGAVTLLLVLGIWGAQRFGFRPAAVWTVRGVTLAVALYAAFRWILLPLGRRVTDTQIAQYVEERFPQLQDRLIAAVEFESGPRVSPGMLDLVIRDALDKTNRVDFSVFSDWRRMSAYGAAAAGALLLLVGLFQWAPSFFPYGFGKIYAPWTLAAGRSPLSIEVTPGSVELTRGSDQAIRARLLGFDSPDVKLRIRPEGSSSWMDQSMEPEPRGSGFIYLLVDLQASMRYYVEAHGVRSPDFAIRISDLARVERIDVTYEFPAYTGMAPQTAEDEGDISAISGTKIGLKLRASSSPRAARLHFDDGTDIGMRPSGEREFVGGFPLRRTGAYVVEFEDARGRWYKASREYQVDVAEDAPPAITVAKPMRDLRATSVEEVFTELKAEDDQGIERVELHYSVNGGPEKTLALFQGRPARPPVTATHTFFLEEFGLQPGDVVTYYGRALDNNSVSGPKASSSDIYFIEIRPFEQKYTQSQQSSMPAGGGGEAEEALSRQQKEIISATFKLVRDKELMESKEYSEGLKALSLVQNRLQAQAQSVVDRMQRRGAPGAEPRLGSIADYLRNAIGEMAKAAAHLGAEKPAEALPEEQKALQWLMRAESLYREVQVSFGSRGGGGRGGSQADAEDLADLFELELNKLKNQYETVQRGEQQARDQKLDEALERLKELARRQQQEIERGRLMAQRGGSSSGGSGGGSQSQRQILDEAERLQRQLQRLSRERSSPELNRASGQLQQAIQEMKRALSRSGTLPESTAQAIRALQQLEEARRSLARSQDSGLVEGLEQAVAESEQLLAEQRKVQEGVDRLAQEKAQAGTAEAGKRREDLAARKAALADRVRNLGNKVEDLSRQARKTQRETSARLGDAVSTIRDRRLPERIVSGNQLLEGGYYDILRSREEYIRSGLAEVQRQIESARSGLGQSREGKLEEALNRTRQLAEGLESLRRRIQGREGSARSGVQGQRSAADGAQQGAVEGRPGDTGRDTSGEPRGGPPGSSQASGRQGGGDPTGRSGPTPGSDVRGLSANTLGPPVGIGRHSDEDIRQLRREAQERLGDAQELRGLYDRNSTNAHYLEQVIENLRQLESSRDYASPGLLARLRASVDLMRDIERELSRDLAGLSRREGYFYAGEGEAPDRYRKLVEEYYKKLARGRR